MSEQPVSSATTEWRPSMLCSAHQSPDPKCALCNPWVRCEQLDAELVAARARIEELEAALEQAIAFATIDLTWTVDDIDQRAGWLMSCDANDVEVPKSAYDELANWLRAQEKEKPNDE